jgi:predicted RNase H-like nuclease
MRAVLGIGAAWTTTNPSGVALAAESSNGWELLAAESSYQRFHAIATDGIAREFRPTGSMPSASALLASALALCGRKVDLVAVDMPLSLDPITGRRNSDNAVSRAYGARNCSTHSANELRPGPISETLRNGFHGAGYPLQTTSVSPPGLIEVYTHPALVELADAPERLPYKVSKIGKYWPSLAPEERRIRLRKQWERIAKLLDGQISGVAPAFPGLASSAAGWEMQAYEDALDAVVCAWVGICTLEGSATPFGDKRSAIWIPLPRDRVGSW